MLIPNKYEGYSPDGRRLYYFGGDDDGGGGGAAAPMDTTYQHQIPHFAPEIAPYAQTLLGQAAALTDTEMNPYMQYQGERIAQFSPLQNQSYQNMALMQTQPQLQDATALAGMAGLGALNTQYTFDPSNFNKAFSAATTRDAQGNVTGNTMMNPYMQNVVERQQQDATRQAAIAAQAQQAQAARSGAFGGSGDYLMRGQAAGNLARQKGDIQAQGLNTAYNQAMQQYNTQNQQNAQQQQYGAGLGLQGLQMANQSAQNLGTLGNLQYQQNMGINQMQNQYGLQQQAQVQQDLTNKYQDYLNSQNYPYKQLGFMSDMVRGLPLGSQSTQSMYPQAPPPSTIQSVGAAGMGLYGASKLFGKEGGLMKSYAGGGVTSQQNVDGILDKLSDQQLAQARKTVLARRDIEQAQMIDTEMAQRASIRGGLGGAFNQIPQRRQETMMAANGGIVAFNGDNQSYVTDEQLQETLDEFNPDEGGSNYSAQASRRGMAEIDALDKLVGSKSMTPEQYAISLAKINKAMRDQAGVDTGYEKFAKQLTDMESSGEKRLNEGKGLAALAAIPEMLKGNNAIRGLGGAGAAFAGVYGQYVNAANKEKLSLARMNYDLADAKRKENLGFTKDAVAAMESVRKSEMDANRFAVEKAKAKGILLRNVGAINKPVRGATPNFDIENRELIAADLKATTPMKKGETPEQYEKRLNAMAAREIYTMRGTKDISSNVTSNVKSERDITPGGADAAAKSDTVAAELAKQQEKAVADIKKSIPYLKAMQQKDSAAMQKMEEDARAGVVSGFEKARQQVNPSAKPSSSSSTALPPAALGQLKEGQITTFKNGQQWKLENGKPVKVN